MNKLIPILLIAAIISVLLVFLYLGIGRPTPGGSSTILLQSQQSLIDILRTYHNSSLSYQMLTSLIASKYYAINSINISYSGVTKSRVLGGGTNIIINDPTTLSIQKYGSIGRISSTLYNFSNGNSETITVISDGGKSYTCISNLTNSSITNCYVYPHLNQNLFASLFYENLTGAATAQISSARESSFSGLSCTNTTGSFYAPIVHGSSGANHMLFLLKDFVNVTTTFDMCLSDNYFIPLTVKLNQEANNEGFDGFTGNLNITLNETSVNNNTSSAIGILPGRLLPGPIANITIT